MNDFPRQKLCELIAKYGTALSDEPLRYEGLLRDLCPHNRRDVNVLINALKERVALDLLSSSTSVSVELSLARLSKRLRENQGLTDEIARWSVESWALALGKISPQEFSKEESTKIRSTTRAPRWLWVGLATTAGIALATDFAFYLVEKKSRSNNVATAPSKSSPLPSGTTALPSPATQLPVVQAPARPKSGTLAIQTDPSGALIRLEDGQTQESPATFTNLSAGIVKASIELDRYEPVQSEIEVLAGDVTSVETIKLARSKGTVRVSSEPTGVHFDLVDSDGNHHDGVTPATVSEVATGSAEIVFNTPDSHKETLQAYRNAMVTVNAALAMVAAVPTNPPPPAPTPTPKIFAGHWQGNITIVRADHNGKTTTSMKLLTLNINRTESGVSGIGRAQLAANRKGNSFSIGGIEATAKGLKRQDNANLSVRNDGKTARFVDQVTFSDGSKMHWEGTLTHKQ